MNKQAFPVRATGWRFVASAVLLLFATFAFQAFAQTEEIETVNTPEETIVSEESSLDVFVSDGEVLTPPSLHLLEGGVTEESESTESSDSEVAPEEQPAEPTVTEEPVVEEETQPASVIESTPELTTDKEDYHPGDTATIFGRLFAPLETFLIKIFGSDENEQNYTETEAEVTTDGEGEFSFAYILDNLYRPFYEVTVATLGGDTVAETWFRDSSIGTYDQCANDDGNGYATGDQGCRWVNGNLVQSNSSYFEDDATVQRFWLKGLTPGTTHTVTFKYGTTKGGTHAYDFLTGYDHSENWIALADLCQGIDNCTGAATPASAFPIPEDPNAGTFDDFVRNMTIRGGTITNISVPTVVNGTYAGDSETAITVSYTVDAADNANDMCTSSNGPGNTTITSCGVALFFGAHISDSDDWGAGTTAVSIPGSPYHVSLDAIDGSSAGERDNQMQADAIIVPTTGTIVVDKVTNPSGNATSFSFTTGGTGYQNFSLADASAPNSQVLNAGNYNVSETVPAGWVQGNVSCVSSIGDTETAGALELDANETITCTFINNKLPTLTLQKTVTNDNGGTAVANDFQAKINGNNVPWATAQTLTAGSFTASETNLPTYDAGAWGGDCGTNGSVTLAYGDNKTCTITNNDKAASISGMKFEDMNGNGVKDVGDNGLSGWTIFLDTNGDGDLDGGESSTVTAGDGSYSFTGLSVGTYKVREVQQTGWTQTTTNPSDVVLENGEVVNDVNFGNFKLVSISGKKFSDLDGDGLAREADEPYLEGWTIRLYDTSTNPWTLVDTQVTDGTGSYTFSGLGVGSYKVCEVLQTGWIQTFPNNFADNNASSNNSTEGAKCITRNVDTSGDNPNAANFGNYQIKALEVTKTATTAYTRTHNWDITKSVDVDTVDLFTGDSETVNYDVTVTKTGFTDSGWTVSGTIAVINPNPASTGLTASISDIVDSISNQGNATVTCPGGLAQDLAAGATLNCTYTKTVSDGDDENNTVTVSTTGSVPGGQGQAAVDFGEPTNVVNDTINVTDTYAEDLGATSETKTFEYPRTLTCDNEGKVPNTATITETGQEASEEVTVTCYDLTVTKTADTTYTRTFDWEINKSVDENALHLFKGDSDTVEYTVEVTKDEGTDSDFEVTGTITVTNPAPMDATLTSVTDVLTGDIAATVNCPSMVVPADDSIVCTYSSDLPDATERTNTATAELENGTKYTGTANVTFGEPETKVNDTVDVQDLLDGNVEKLNEQIGDSEIFTYEHTYTCDADEGVHKNTATVTGSTGVLGSDEETVTVSCYDLTVTKTANTSYTKTWVWDIDKTSTTSVLNLAPGQTYPVYYEVGVTASPTDSNWAVAGTITIVNPAPMDAVLSDVSDMLPGDIEATVNCPTMTVPDGESVVCTYTAALPSAGDLINTAEVTTDNGTVYTGTANVSFVGATMTEIDETIEVTDDKKGLLGTVLASNAPYTFKYVQNIGPYESTACGTTQKFDNTAELTTNDTETTADDTVIVDVNVRCTCSLTQGYWKTHNDTFHGGAPTDDNWENVSPNAELTGFFTLANSFPVVGPNPNTFTWYSVFWTAPKGNVYYNMAHQYMAAKLNVLNGAYNPTISVDIAAAEVLLKTYTPAQIAGLKGKKATDVSKQFNDLAGKFGAFNEGKTNPAGHCTEIPQ